MDESENRRRATGKTRILAVLAAGAAAVSLLALSAGSLTAGGTDGGSGKGRQTLHAPRDLAGVPAVLTGSIVQTDQQWVCSGPVDLDSVTVTMDQGAQSLPRTGMDAVHLENGCTGTIRNITIVQYAADGIKVGNGAHDLTIGGGSIHCYDKAPTLHQDGIQVMSGVDITFQNLTIDCGRPGGGVINSEIFFNRGLDSTLPPTNVVCDSCQLGPNAAHTVSIQDSLDSGVRNSIVCPARFARLAMSIGPAAVDPVNANNELSPCTDTTSGAGTAIVAPTTPATTTTAGQSSNPDRLTIGASASVVTNGGSALLSGKLVSGRPGREIDVYQHPFDASGETLLATLRTDSAGGWQLTVHPRVGTTYSARARSFSSLDLLVHVRPVVLLHAGTRQLTIRAQAERPLAGATVALQRLDGAHWHTVATVRLGPRSGAVVPLTRTLAGKLRVSLPALPGYLGATSATVTAPARP